jgi:hypothetical protein
MDKKLLIAILTISIISINIAFSEDVCKYVAGQTIFRCDNSMPNLVITPGTEQNLTINCCLTGDSYNNTDNYNAHINIVLNQSFGKQYVENETRITEINLVIYNSSKWIADYYLPENITGFQAFPVTITYKTPLFSNEYIKGAVLKSRFDLSVNIPGTMIPQLAILPNIMLPADYKPIDYMIYVYLIGGAVLLAILFIITFKSSKINQKVKGLLGKLKRKEKKQETQKEPKVEKKEGE